MLAKARLGKEEVREEYGGKLNERLRGARTRMRERMNVNDVYDIFKAIVMGVAPDVVGWRGSGGRENEMHGGQMKFRMQ